MKRSPYVQMKMIPESDDCRAYFDFSLRPSPSTDTLILNLSAWRKFMLGGVAFPFTTLDMVDKYDRYYVYGAAHLLRALKTFIVENGFRFVFLMGSSKGGFGSLMLSTHLAEEFPDIHFKVVAFSPQAAVWPPNPELPYKTYKKMIATAEAGDKLLQSDLELFGTKPQLGGHRNASYFISYGNRNRLDVKQVRELGKFKATLEPLPMSSHTSMVPYLCNANDPEKARRVVTQMISRMDSDSDLAFDINSGPKMKLFHEIMEMLPRPYLPDLLRWLRDRHEVALRDATPAQARTLETAV